MCLYTKNEPYRTRSSFWVAEREGFASKLYIFAYRSRLLAEIRAPVRGLRRPCVFSKKEKKEPLLVPSSFLRRERDSNPRSLSAQRFSRPPQSTTLPSLLRRNWLARRNSLCKFGLPPLLLLTRAHEARVIFWGVIFSNRLQKYCFFLNCANIF